MIFWRILDNKVYAIGETNKLGFEESEGLRIPDEYLERQEFTILRAAWGIGDWGIISAMPRLLKQKYPNCKIYIPSKKLIKKLFNIDTNIMYDIFKNNPYVDEFKDEIKGEIFHDHYRIYDKDNPNIPLIEQMLKFWQFENKKYKDSQPELYWTNEEKELGDYIIQKHIPYFYWSVKPLNKTSFNFINKALNLRHINLRIQLYIKSKAKLNISNQCGTNHLVVRYSKVYESQRQSSLQHNFIKEINYL